MLLGCSIQEGVDYRLIKKNLPIDQISYIEIEIDVYKKIITDQQELDSLTSYIEDIQILDNRLENVKSIEDNMVRLKIYNKSGSIIESISIGEEATYYNNKWYPIGIQTYDNIRTFYKNAGYEVLEDNILSDIKQRKFSRKEKLITELLQGIWLNENDSTIKFDNNYLKRGNQFKYIFKYNIDKIDDNDLDISIYGITGLFIKDKKLSELYIKMDPTKTHMIMKSIMIDGMTYYDNFVYVDKDGLTLGSFDSYFFYVNSMH